MNHIVLKGFVFPATGGFLPPGFPGYSEGIGIPYDPEKAHRLLAEAGYPKGYGMQPIHGWVFVDGAAHAQFLQSSWEEILGVETTWEVMEWSEYMNRITKEPPQVFGEAWLADYPDPDSFLRANNLLHSTRWHSDVYENLINTARHASDQEERMRLYRQADRMLIEEAIIVPLSYTQDHLLIKPWVERFPVSSLRWLYGKDIIIKPH